MRPERRPPEGPRPETLRLSLPLPADMSGGHVHAYHLPGSLPTLVDCGLGHAEGLEALEAGLHEAGASWEGLERLVISHAHIDHLGLADRVQAASGCQILAHPEALPMLADFGAAWRARLELHLRAAEAGGVPGELQAAFRQHFLARGQYGPKRAIDESALRALRDRERIRAGGSSWSVAWLPGHSPDHIGLVHASSGTALTGDLLLRGAGTIPFLAGRDARGRRPSTLEDLIGSWRRLGRMRLAILWPGHGGPVRAHRVLIARRLAELRRRLAQTRAALGSGGSSIWEVCCALGPEPPAPANLQSRLGESVALLDWLVEHGRATRRMDDGRLIYRRRDRQPPPRR